MTQGSSIAAGSTASHPAGENLAQLSEFATFQAEYINSCISFADTKAAWTFAGLTGMTAYLASLDSLWVLAKTPPGPLLWVLAFGALALFVTSMAMAFFVVVPRLGGAPAGFVYFGAVATRSDASAYATELIALPDRSLIEGRLQHIYELARICQRKFAVLRIAIWCGGFALLDAIALIAALKLGAR